VLAAEAPMHVDLLARRVGAYFGVGRVTDRSSIRSASAARRPRPLGRRAGVVWRLDQDPDERPPGARRRLERRWAPRYSARCRSVEVAAAARIVVERGHDVAAAISSATALACSGSRASPTGSRRGVALGRAPRARAS